MTTRAVAYLRERGDSYARDAAKFRDAKRAGEPITGAVQDAHWAEVYQIIADELRKCAMQIEEQERMPAWNCVDSDGPHYLNAAAGCEWCGQSREQIAASDNPVGGRS